MRVVRILLGMMLVTVAVLAFLSGGALWIAMQHASGDGGFGGSVTGLATGGNAIVVPDVDALLRAQASLTGRSGTSVSIDASTAGGPAFVGLAPLSSIQAYLGPVPYARVTSLRTGSGGLPVTVAQVPGAKTASAAKAAKPAAIPGGAPATQDFWTLSGTDGRIKWSPSEKKYDQLALVIMRTDGHGPVVVTATGEVKADWLASTAWALFSLGTVLAVAAVALLLWPVRRREIVYVVTPTQLPEIAERLGVPLDSYLDRVSVVPAVDIPAQPERPAEPDGECPAWAGPTPTPSVRATVPVSPRTAIPDIFADPSRRPNSLRTAMLLNPVNAGPHASPVPLPTNERGIYRSFGTPPPVTPSFLWTQADELDSESA